LPAKEQSSAKSHVAPTTNHAEFGQPEAVSEGVGKERQRHQVVDLPLVQRWIGFAFRAPTKFASWRGQGFAIIVIVVAIAIIAVRRGGQSFAQTFVSFGAFSCGRDLGLLGMFRVQKKTKGGIISLSSQVTKVIQPPQDPFPPMASSPSRHCHQRQLPFLNRFGSTLKGFFNVLWFQIRVSGKYLLLRHSFR
jgi:hypothetical protein